MSLHALGVFDIKVLIWSPLKELHFKSTIKCFKEVKIDKWPKFILLISPHRHVRINGKPDRLFSSDIQS